MTFLLVVDTAYRGKYPDFGPTFAAEKMAENDGIHIKAGTLRNLPLKPESGKRGGTAMRTAAAVNGANASGR